MSKIIINSKIKSSDETNIIKDKLAVFKDGVINYKEDDLMVSIKISKDKITIKRENSKMKIKLKFDRDNETTSEYNIKDLNLKIGLLVNTKKLSINKNKITIRYELFMNKEYSDTFDYVLEWSDL